MAHLVHLLSRNGSGTAGTITDNGTTSSIRTVTVVGTSSGPFTVTGSGTTSIIGAITVAATRSGIGTITAVDTGVTVSVTSSGTTLIGYVHNVFPVKRNKRNPLNYSTFTQQVEEKSMHDAPRYSRTKRAILTKKEASRIAVKIARTCPNSLKYPNQPTQ